MSNVNHDNYPDFTFHLKVVGTIAPPPNILFKVNCKKKTPLLRIIKMKRYTCNI